MKTNMKKHILGGLLMVAAGTAFTACSSDFLDTQPTDRVGTDLEHIRHGQCCSKRSIRAFLL